MLPYSDLIQIENGVRIDVLSEKEPPETARLFSSFSSDDTITLRLCLSKSYASKSATLYLYDDESQITLPLPGYTAYSASGYHEDVFDFVLSQSKLCKLLKKPFCTQGLYYYTFRVESATGDFTVSQNEAEGGCLVNCPEESESRFQLLFYDAAFETPDYAKGGIMYQIFVDRFCKAGEVPVRDDAELWEDWYNAVPEYPAKPGDPLKNNEFFGGTLYGVCEKLDYLQSLGVNILYLNPIFEAYSNHKYDTGDYSKVDAMFGGEEALQKLLTEAKKRGIRVILDGVFNHTGDDSLYFNRYGRYPTVGAYQSSDSPFYPWYHFTQYPESYDSWWGIKILPRVNSGHPDFQEFLCGDQGIIKKYMDMGVSGWRLDVADELDESLIQKLRARIRKENPEGILYGEVWEDASNKIAYSHRRHYFSGKMLDSVMNYPLKNALIEYILSEDSAQLSFTMRTLYAHYPKAASDVLMNLLGTHDTERILTVLSGSPLGSESNDVQAQGYMSDEEKYKVLPKLKLAWALLCCFPGIPCIYYGDEAGMDGYHDPFNRRPYPWGRELNELVEFYRQIGQIRRNEPIFAKGYYRELRHDGPFFAFERFEGDQSVYILSNVGQDAYTFELDKPMVSLFTDFDKSLVYHKTITLPPMSFAILKTQK